MFIGHYAVALAAKRATPQTSLGALFAATQLPDLVWPVAVLGGWETVEIVPGVTAFNPLDFTSYPWSHSLLMVAAWGAAAGLAWWAATRDRRGAVIIGLLAVSHWILDWITHRPDLPLWPGATEKLGLGLWQSVAATLVLELGLYAAGAWLYFQGTAARDRAGRWGVTSLLALLALFYVADRFGTPPPNSTFLGWFALIGGLLPVVWAWWGDRHRASRTPGVRP
jgi:membrane-bound metal-dependent hydrolase YbcI (DUF457 family)